MFLGEHQHNIDEKGRLAIPAKFRMFLNEGGVVARSLDNQCLTLYPRKQWEEIAQKLAGIPINQTKARAFARLILSGAVEAEFDKQGRIVVADYLRKFAKINKKIIIAGLYDKIEIWDEEEWLKYKKASDESREVILKELGEIGL